MLFELRYPIIVCSKPVGILHGLCLIYQKKVILRGNTTLKRARYTARLLHEWLAMRYVPCYTVAALEPTQVEQC